MVIEGGWVCRACWRPNGPKEERCYRCHTPRDQQLAVEAGSLKKQTEVGAELVGRLDTNLGLIAWLVVLPMRVGAVLSIVVGGFLFVLGLLLADRGLPQVGGLDGNIVVSLAGLLAILNGALTIFLVKSVLRHARWAYVVMLLLSLAAIAPRVLGAEVPDLTSEAAQTVWWIATWWYVAIGLSMALLLLASFVRQEAAPGH
jgi:hypothetical protein